MTIEQDPLFDIGNEKPSIDSEKFSRLMAEFGERKGLPTPRSDSDAAIDQGHGRQQLLARKEEEGPTAAQHIKELRDVLAKPKN